MARRLRCHYIWPSYLRLIDRGFALSFGNITFWPVVLQDGHVAGNWTSTKDKVTITPFRQDMDLNQESLEKEISRYLNYLKR